MYQLKVENKYGEILELSQNPNYVIKSIDGIDPPDAIINTTRNANADGSVFNSAYVDNRTITITLAINQPTEENRISLYKYFKSKYPVTIYYKNDSRNVLINGYIQNIPIGYFEKKEVFQVTIFCPEPYFEGVEQETSHFDSAIALFEFPFSISTPIPFSQYTSDRENVIMNNGDIETGALFVLHATGGPVVNPGIVNMQTNETFNFNITLEAGDEIRLNTVVKQKSVILVKKNGTIQNLIANSINASWFQLRPNENYFSVTATSGIANLDATIYLKDKFMGV